MKHLMAGDMGTNSTEFVISGVTRREALRRGTLLGAGAVWAAPAVRSLTMSQNFATATSPFVDDEEVEKPGIPEEPPGTTEEQPPGGGTSTKPPDTTVGGEVVTKDDEPKTSNPDEVKGIQVSRPGVNQAQVQAGELPLTGIEAVDAAVLGAGLAAAGAAILKATQPDPDPQS